MTFILLILRKTETEKPCLGLIGFYYTTEDGCTEGGLWITPITQKGCRSSLLRRQGGRLSVGAFCSAKSG